VLFQIKLFNNHEISLKAGKPEGLEAKNNSPLQAFWLPSIQASQRFSLIPGKFEE
jgi:hypothetical protein